MEATVAYDKVLHRAEEIRNDQPQSFPTMSVGDTVRQGDIYITRLKELPKNLKPAESRQLAPGSTQGSRHVALSGDLFVESSPSPLCGPYIKAKEDFTIDHPEHANVTLPPGVFHVTYQLAHADEVRRVQD